MADYDSIVLTKISDLTIHFLAYKIVINIMIYDLYGIMNPKTLYIKNGIYQKHYPKFFQKSIQENDNKYSAYHRQDNGYFIETRNQIQLDNRWIMLYNLKLITKYNVYINVKICSSDLVVKYLYKYIYKGYNQAIIILFQSNQLVSFKANLINKIKMYLNIRYILAFKSA